jgi:hypothetical protein
VYAIVQYDFQAERPDELDAKKGEPIVVIAQSNHEWCAVFPRRCAPLIPSGSLQSQLDGLADRVSSPSLSWRFVIQPLEDR